MPLYKCEIPGCLNTVAIRTEIKNKDSEFFGKKACPKCASEQNVQKEKKIYKIKNRTDKTTEKRKEERKDYPEFFNWHIQNIKENNLSCENCGDKLKGDSSNVCHLISKSSNPEIATLDDNIIYLCGLFSKNNCHSVFDNSFESREKMNVFPLAVEKFNKFKNQLIRITKEVLHYDSF